jgi:hypothetical protein
MTAVQDEPSSALPSHPEEMRASLDLRIGDSIVMQAHARTTPAGVLCTGLAVAAMMLAVGYLAGAARRRV